MISDNFYKRTERLILRTATEKDAEALARARSTEFVMRYNLYTECDGNQIKKELAAYEHILLAEADTQRIIGCVSMRDDPLRYHVASVTLHAWLVEDSAYKGYMLEALKEIIDLLFLENERVSVQIFSQNTASIRLAKKLGFQEEGFIERAVKNKKGEIFDVVLMSLAKWAT